MKLTIVAIGLASVCALGVACYAMAGMHYVKYFYYSDASYTTQVGATTRVCSGHTYSTGTVTQYRVLEAKFNCYL